MAVKYQIINAVRESSYPSLPGADLSLSTLSIMISIFKFRQIKLNRFMEVALRGYEAIEA